MQNWWGWGDGEQVSQANIYECQPAQEKLHMALADCLTGDEGRQFKHPTRKKKTFPETKWKISEAVHFT